MTLCRFCKRTVRRVLISGHEARKGSAGCLTSRLDSNGELVALELFTVELGYLFRASRYDAAPLVVHHICHS